MNTPAQIDLFTGQPVELIDSPDFPELPDSFFLDDDRDDGRFDDCEPLADPQTGVVCLD